MASLYFKELKNQIGKEMWAYLQFSQTGGEKGYRFLFPDVVFQFSVEDETRPKNTHPVSSVLGKGDLSSRFFLSSVTEMVAFVLLKDRLREMELKPFPQLFQQRNDSDLVGGGISTH